MEREKSSKAICKPRSLVTQWTEDGCSAHSKRPVLPLLWGTPEILACPVGES